MSVTIRGIKVYSYSNYNNDGIDIDSKNVLIENCLIESDDDGICLKSDLPVACENVTVRNCTIRSNCNAIKLGTSSYGGFRNIEISDCTVEAAPESPIYNWSELYDWGGIAQGISGLAGIAVECVDGGFLENVRIHDIDIEGVQTPIFVRLGDRNRKYSGEISRLRTVDISNVKAVASSRIACSITGVGDGDPGIVEDITLKDIEILIPGGGESSDGLSGCRTGRNDCCAEKGESLGLPAGTGGTGDEASGAGQQPFERTVPASGACPGAAS